MNRRLVLAAGALLALPLFGCSHEAPGVPEPIPAIALEKLAGDGGTSVAGAAISPTVRVVRGGVPVSGATVRFAVRSGGGTLLDTLVTAGSDGTAATLWLLGRAGAAQTLSAQVNGVTAEFSVAAAAPAPGTAYFGRNAYVEYVPGELPIILSAPHGGSLQPAEIPDRTSGTTVQDLNTDDLARRMAAALEELTGRRPHLVLMHLHRRKLDANREIEEAAQGSALAERAWHEYHSWIETAKDAVSRDQARGFYVDVHGHGHPIQRLELGYLLSAAELGRSDAVLNQPRYAAESSIHALAQHSSLTFTELLRGEQSLGEILTRNGYPSVPSRSDPNPDGAPYFSGGYSTARHGSQGGGQIDAVQVESNYQIIRDTPANRDAFARAFAVSLLEYLAVHRGIVLAPATAVTAGERMLRSGGDAVDAGVAAGFVIRVLEPMMSGIGGSGGMRI